MTTAPAGHSATEVERNGWAARVADILGMIKFSHTVFALPFAVLGGALAARTPNGWLIRPLDWVAILLCMVFARSAAMAFNRLADHAIDAKNPRTATRHLPAGRLSRGAVLVFTVVCSLGFVASTLLLLPRNPWPLFLSVPVLVWLLGYSFAKRFTSLAHVWLGAALGLAPVCAWVAVRGEISWPPVVLGLAVICWVTGFDILYACQDAGHDRVHGLHSIPARLGVARALRVAAAAHVAMIFWLLVLAWIFPLGWVFRVGLAAITALLVYEHSLVKENDLAQVNVAFFHVNGIISAALLGLGIVDLALQ